MIPYAKIDSGYCQTIQDPNVENGFIALQVVTPRYKTDNTVFHMGIDPTEQELETDEARRFGAKNKVKNDMFRTNQNRYGQLHECDPC